MCACVCLQQDVSTYFLLCDGPASKLRRPRRRVAVFGCCWMQVGSLDKAGFQPFLPIQIVTKSYSA